MSLPSPSIDRPKSCLGWTRSAGVDEEESRALSPLTLSSHSGGGGGAGGMNTSTGPLLASTPLFVGSFVVFHVLGSECRYGFQ